MKKLLMMLFAIATICVVAMLGTTSASAATSGTTGDCTWTLDGTVLTINGNGEMGDYDWDGGPWGKEISKVIIEDGVTSIGDYAFVDCSSLTSVTIPDSVMNIGCDAFFYCYGLTNIYVGNNNVAYCDIDGVLFNKDKTALILYPVNKPSRSYTIPGGV